MENEKAAHVLHLIISAAHGATDSLEFGQAVAAILEDNQLIDPAVHDILAGKL